MIKQRIAIEGYWKVIVYYNVDYNFFNSIVKELLDIGAPYKVIDEIFYTMSSGKSKACTYSSIKKHMSIVLFNTHMNSADYINSIVHEAEHIKQAMLYAYHIKDLGEPPAYTIGYLVEKMYKIFVKLL